MAAIGGKNNRSTEGKFLELFRENKIVGWRRHPEHILGKPDFVFFKQRIAVFADGCFWHGCPKCRLHPKSNITFWTRKIKRNKKRDAEIKKPLEQKGWSVIRFWEHQINKNPEGVIRQIKAKLSGKS